MCLRWCADKLSALVAGTGPHIRCEGRNLRTATDLRAVRKSLLADHLDVPGGTLSQDVFPDSGRLGRVMLLREPSVVS
jgi:uncharacterized protein (DUF1501 family)